MHKNSKIGFGICFGIIILLLGLIIISVTSCSKQPSKSSGKTESTAPAESPKTEVKEEKTTEKIPFETKEEKDSNLEEGQTQTKQEGQEGEKEITYKITLENGKEIKRDKVSEKVIKEPVIKIVSIGTKIIIQPQPSTKSVAPASKYSCGSKSTCGQMSSCEEAKYFYNTCGLSKLDRDKDGVPCETLCE